MKTKTVNTKILCPFCSEKIASSAKKCRYCGEWLNINPTTKRTLFSRKKIILVVIAIIVLFIIKDVLWTSSGVSSVQTQTTMKPTEQSLRRDAEEQYRLIASGNVEDWTRLYNEFYTPDNSIKTKSLDDFVTSSHEHRLDMKNKGLNHVEFEIHSIKVNGAIGYVDRTEKPCGNSDCSKTFATPQRLTRKYIFIGGRWLMTDAEVSCNRDKPYEMAPEFERAISLITQRLENTNNGEEYDRIVNCLSVQYANSEKEMEGNEGFFSFHKGQSTDKLEIFVSPKYKIKDDLITAILLVHEITHATLYSMELRYGTLATCYENEAAAFDSEIVFFSSLNKEEQSSITTRIAEGNSDELLSIDYFWGNVYNSEGTNRSEKILNFIKTIPAYQKQCANQ